VFYFLKEKHLINMVIPILKGSKNEDPKVFLMEYKKPYIGTGFRIVVEWLINLFPKFTLV
jgi:hypothetical protein